ncbi:MAG: asparagine synthase (glutamine-hydrolyzing) [Candidatus Krumholzibacteriia bacterium]
MCGICGAVALRGPLSMDAGTPERMVGALRHRGPDEFGAWRDAHAFLGHARLSIIDPAGGQQPLTIGDGRYWIVFNGEIFNYPELNRELAGRGHRLRTRSDTETIVHAYREWGEDCVHHFNGQFAFALWDRHLRRLFLARDRFGIRPLYITEYDGHLLFASEVKALGAWSGCRLEVDPEAVAEVFTYWSTLPPRTVFRGVAQVPPGHTAVLEGPAGGAGGRPAGDAAAAATRFWPGRLRLRRYWHPTFLPEAEDRRFVPAAEQRRLAELVREQLVRAATLRLRADVPVGACLSGGLDSSATAAVICRHTSARLKTFGLGFDDPEYDESDWQRAVAAHLGTDHHAVRMSREQIAAGLGDMTWHAETPVLRTAPVPLRALSALVRSQRYKVVLTGEGADEVFAGYNIFREAKVRWFWARRPQDAIRGRLLTRLYPYLEASPPRFLAGFYSQGLDRPADPFFSHRPRWWNTGRMTTFLVPDALHGMRAGEPEERLAASLPDDFAGWGVVARAQYLEMTTFLAGYLLSSQGDRMLMGDAVEGRFPFLDHELAELAGTLPASVKLQSLRDKSILRAGMVDLLPAAVVNRPKQPFRAPDSSCFAGHAGRALAAGLLDDRALSEAGLWRVRGVTGLRDKWQAGRLTSARENMAFIGILTTQLLLRQFGPELAARLDEQALPPGTLVWRTPPATTAGGPADAAPSASGRRPHGAG